MIQIGGCQIFPPKLAWKYDSLQYSMHYSSIWYEVIFSIDWDFVLF